jgi:hypothetical protein
MHFHFRYYGYGHLLQAQDMTYVCTRACIRYPYARIVDWIYMNRAAPASCGYGDAHSATRFPFQFLQVANLSMIQPTIRPHFVYRVSYTVQLATSFFTRQLHIWTTTQCFVRHHSVFVGESNVLCILLFQDYIASLHPGSEMLVCRGCNITRLISFAQILQGCSIAMSITTYPRAMVPPSRLKHFPMFKVQFQILMLPLRERRRSSLSIRTLFVLHR